MGIQANPRQAIDLAAKHGFDAIDADGKYLQGISDAEVQDLLGYMRTKNVAWALAGLPVDFRGEDSVFRDGMSRFPPYAAGLKRAGVQRLTTWIMPRSETLTYRANFQQHANRLREVARVLNDSGIRFGLEYIGPKTLWTVQRYPFSHTMAETRELIAEIGQPNVGMVLDSWHWYHAGDNANDISALRPKDIVSVDLNDAPSGIAKDQMVDGKRELPASTGIIDVKSFLGALEKIAYDGPVRVEPFNDAVRRMPPDESAAAAMAALKKAFAA